MPDAREPLAHFAGPGQRFRLTAPQDECDTCPFVIPTAAEPLLLLEPYQTTECDGVTNDLETSDR